MLQKGNKIFPIRWGINKNEKFKKLIMLNNMKNKLELKTKSSWPGFCSCVDLLFISVKLAITSLDLHRSSPNRLPLQWHCLSVRQAVLSAASNSRYYTHGFFFFFLYFSNNDVTFKINYY
jgi:hypothetical protein